MIRRFLLAALLLLGLPLAAFAAPKATAATSMIQFVAPDTWTVLQARVDNPDPQEFQGLVLMNYESDPELQFGAPVWLPPNSSGYFWFVARNGKPVPTSGASPNARILSLKTANLLLNTSVTPERQLTRDEHLLPLHGGGTHPVVISDYRHDPGELISALQRAQGLRVNSDGLMRDRMPPVAAGYDSATLVVLAVENPALDAARLLALRQWVQGGGRLWIMADITSFDLIGRLLGNAGLVQRVDDTQIAAFQFTPPGRDGAVYRLDPPAKMVRVLAPSMETLLAVNGWPALLRGRVGLGDVLISTVDSSAWFKARKTLGDAAAQDLARALFDPRLAPPLPRVTLQDIVAPRSAESTPQGAPRSREAQAGARFQGFLLEQFGYQVVPRNRIAWVLAAFCVVVFLTGLVLQRRRRLEYVGPLAVLLVLLASASLVGLGRAYRGDKPLTVAAAQVGHVLPAQDAIATAGIVSVYTPGGATGSLEINQGGIVWPDLSTQSGHLVRLVTIDRNVRRYEGLQFRSGARLPAEVRNVLSARPPRVRGHFGPAGFEGALDKGDCPDLTDLVLVTPTAARLAPREETISDNLAEARRSALIAADADTLRRLDEFIRSATMLSGAQEQHQRMYAAMLNLQRPGEPPARLVPERPLLLGWTDQLLSGVHLAQDKQHNESTLLAIPLEIEPSPPGRVIVPGPFLPYTAASSGVPALASKVAAYAEAKREWIPFGGELTSFLQFQLPPAVLPLRVENQSVRLVIDAPRRDVTLLAVRNNQAVRLGTFKNPTPGTPLVVELSADQGLPVDAQGAFVLGVQVQENTVLTETTPSWLIHDLSVTVTGVHTAPVQP